MKLFVLLLTMVIVSSMMGNEVNVYSHRDYDTDKELFRRFTEKTGIKVNVVKAKADELISRIEREGGNTPADLLITVDAGRVFRAKEKGILQPISDSEIENNVPSSLRDSENYWVGLTIRSRVLANKNGTIVPSELSTYEDLISKKWEGEIVIRSSQNMYNQSLLASIIANKGEEYATKWAKGMVKNMARTPKGNDRDQMKAVFAGVGKIAVVNTYYVGKLLNSKDSREVKVGRDMKLFFPNQDDRGAHINISGAGIIKQSKNVENAKRLLRYLTSEEDLKL